MMMIRLRLRRHTDELKHQILKSLAKHGPTNITVLMYEAEINHREIKRLVTELIEADLMYMTTAEKAPLTEKQRRRILWPHQKLFIITKKGRKCAKLMSQNSLRI